VATLLWLWTFVTVMRSHESVAFASREARSAREAWARRRWPSDGKRAAALGGVLPDDDDDDAAA
jgi:hypothetical protein